MGLKEAMFAVLHDNAIHPIELTPLLQEKKSLELPGPGFRQLCPGCTFLTSDLCSNRPQQAFVWPRRQPFQQFTHLQKPLPTYTSRA